MRRRRCTRRRQVDLSNYGVNGDSAIALAASLQLMPHAKEVLLQNNNIDVRGAMPLPCRAGLTERAALALRCTGDGCLHVPFLI